MQMNGENCTDHTDYTDADEQRFRKIRRIRTEQISPRNTHFGQKESEQETHKLNIFLRSKDASYVILRKFLHDFGHSA